MSLVTEDRPQLWASEPSATPGHERIRARIAGLHCSLCTGTIEKALGRMDGVDTVAVSLTHEQALVDYDPQRVSPEQILGTLRDVGYELYDPRKLRPFEEEERDLVREGARLLAAIAASLTAIGLIATVTGIWSVLVPASVVALMVPLSFALLRPAGNLKALAGAVAIVTPGVAALVLRATGVLAEPLIGWLAGVLAVGVVVGVAPHILRMAYQSARRGILNQHVLLEVGAFAGIAGGVIGLTGVLPGYPTAAFFAVSVLVANYHIFSEWLSLLVKTRSSQSVKKLLDLQPDLARVVDTDGGESEVPVEDVALGQVVRVRPGERIPLDGRIRSGASAIDLSLVTGEPIPAERGPGEEVVGGSINGTGSLLIEVTASHTEGFLAQVVRHVEDARALKPGILHLVDRVLRVYTPTVLTIAALALFGWLAGSWALAGEPDVRRAVFAALSVLVMGYPCAVGIAAPLAIVRGTGAAADRGIVMRTGEAFQTFRLVTRIVLDKTGTLTQGRPTVRTVDALDGDTDGLLAVAAGAEGPSEHPLARAVVTAARERGLIVPTAEEFASVTGSGVRATVHGREVLVGQPAFLTDNGLDLTAVTGRVDQLQAAGHTVIVVAVAGTVEGLIALGDEVRADAAEAVARMRAVGMDPVLVTGDNERAARRVADQLGISQVRAGVRPEGKAEIVRELQADGTRVAMVGDGINDAPALMQADVGVAAGGGTDIAVESADIVLLRDEVTAVLDAREISDRSYRRTRTNVGLAFTLNGIGVPLATTGLVYPVWAMIAMAASVTAIFLNSIGTRPSLLVQAISSVGRQGRQHDAEQAETEHQRAAA
ncbi:MULTISPECIES: heavy metal translocating P-type ATPase [Prauserella]|uniref:Cation-translocating P-type ATPase n=2 Tax=Prauserella TaxID=142577 RepID=A0ABY2RWP4_9PSEU|nr:MULTISPECIES: cation-translocating P-type ATPase [Prauserella]PXY17762.1 copper-translocating P-type ATPase [Prauserella flavalba]PXY18669.1 copper-translocating P-type ATPase [Prauserella coralliicola]TKG63602.1 cation-translocating P-type ATPase [Prauserella endophytica]